MGSKRKRPQGEARPTNALEWENCHSLDAMVYGCLTAQTSTRKLGLFAIACCRQIWHLLRDKRAIRAVDLSERAADGDRRSSGWLERDDWMASREGWSYDEQVLWSAAKYAAQADTRSGALRAAFQVRWARSMLEPEREEDEESQQCNLLRDIMGNPFAPLLEDPGWAQAHSIDVAPLALSIYNERRFSDLPALADAMIGSGCRDEAMIEHCRRPGEHARGCWLIDTILGRHEGAVVLFDYLLPTHLRLRRDRRARD